MYDTIETLKETISDPRFHEFAIEANMAKEGYSLRINPATGKKEMFVTGSRTISDWLLNVMDSAFLDLDKWRYYYQRKLSRIAIRNQVDIVYGHSRGGAIVADMRLPKRIQKVGLSAAMIIAKNKNLVNLNEGGTNNTLSEIDTFLGCSGRNNISVDFSPSYPHRPWNIK